MPSQTKTGPDREGPSDDLRKKLLANHKRGFGDSIMGFRIKSCGLHLWRVCDDEDGAYSDWLCRPRAKRIRCVGFRSHDGARVRISTDGQHQEVDVDPPAAGAHGPEGFLMLDRVA